MTNEYVAIQKREHPVWIRKSKSTIRVKLNKFFIIVKLTDSSLRLSEVSRTSRFGMECEISCFIVAIGFQCLHILELASSNPFLGLRFNEHRRSGMTQLKCKL